MLDQRKAGSLGEALVWYHFVPTASEAGKRWYRTFRDSGAERIAYRVDHAVELLRKSRLAAGREMLDRCRQDYEKIAGSIDEPTAAILAESFCGAEAYGLYLEGRYERAMAGMEAAEAAVRRTLELAPFLLSFTQKCKQLCLHKARIARKQRNWQEMRRLIELAKAMVAGRAPLCTLERGPIFVDEVYRWLAALVATDELEAEALASLANFQRNIVAFDHLSREAEMIPHVAIDAF